jgi:predicted transcriptional regulator
MLKHSDINKKIATHKKAKVTITTDGERGFFERGKEIAKLADAGKFIPASRIINFDSPEEMLAILTKVRRNLMALLRERDASITDIANLLRRDRAAVAKDIKLLEHYGLVTISDEINPGHRHRKIVHAISKQPILLAATI